jgi:uncharacterized protein (TIGR03435 family)
MRFAITIFLASTALAQNPPGIDVATVKLNTSGGESGDRTIDPTRMRFLNMPLRVMLRNAYGVRNDQIVGLPGWIDTLRWDVEATTTAPATQRQMFDLLQGLLAERLKMQVHRETRDVPKYRLSLAKGGLKMADSTGDDGQPYSRTGPGQYEGRKIGMSQFCTQLIGMLGQPIDDATGLTGKYNFKLEWAATPKQEETRPSIFTAIQELGLRLESIKGPIEVLVIDHVEKPVIE